MQQKIQATVSDSEFGASFIAVKKSETETSKVSKDACGEKYRKIYTQGLI